MGKNINSTALCSPFLFPFDYKNRFPDCSGELVFPWEQEMPVSGCREKDEYFVGKGDEGFFTNKKGDSYDIKSTITKKLTSLKH